jgi:hypothetical protein
VAGSCEYGDEPLGSGATELISKIIIHILIKQAHVDTTTTLKMAS